MCYNVMVSKKETSNWPLGLTKTPTGVNTQPTNQLEVNKAKGILFHPLNAIMARGFFLFI